MQKFNRLVTRVLPYLQPHVQSCGFTKKINSESWDCLTMCKKFFIFNPMCKVVTLQKNHFRVLGLFNNMQKLPYLQSHVQGLWVVVIKLNVQAPVLCISFLISCSIVVDFGLFHVHSHLILQNILGFIDIHIPCNVCPHLSSRHCSHLEGFV